ncbi:hypothetical protein APA_4928 [Pseudanabaena sp. lw0831]|nr:hypothetical protein APA_4928 [Pseudanabaena sp. lw0831]
MAKAIAKNKTEKRVEALRASTLFSVLNDYSDTKRRLHFWVMIDRVGYL